MISAIVLSAGKGTRMKSEISKQYMQLKGKPVLYYSLKAFEESMADEIVVVVGKDDTDFVKREIIEKYGFKKVGRVVSGGEYRFNSVYNGLKAVNSAAEYVFIHDGARPLIKPWMIEKLYAAVKEKRAVTASCPAKDTVKMIEPDGKIVLTPPRESLVQVQTPQTFEYGLVKEAYDRLIDSGDSSVTDDAAVVEKYGNCDVYAVDTGYANIKITTPEDLLIAEALM